MFCGGGRVIPRLLKRITAHLEEFTGVASHNMKLVNVRLAHRCGMVIGLRCGMWNGTIHLQIICKYFVLRGEGVSNVADIYQK